MEKDQKFYEMVVSVGVAVFSCFLLYTAFATKASAPPGMMSAMDFPKALLFGILVLSLYLVVRNLSYWKRETTADREGSRTDPRVWITAGLIIAYALAWKYIGFSPASFAYIIIQAKVLNQNLKSRNLFFVSLLSTATLLVIFKVVFKVSLSENLLEMLEIL